MKAMFPNAHFTYAAGGLTCEIEALIEGNKLGSTKAANPEISRQLNVSS
jgi:hypothetical protein